MNKYFSLLLISALFFLQPLINGHVINVATQEDFGKLINKDSLTVVKFYTTWCGACKTAEELFNQMSQDISSKKINFAQVDIDNLKELGHTYNIEYIPQFLLFQYGRLIKKYDLNEFNLLKEEIGNQINTSNKHDNAFTPKSTSFSTSITVTIKNLIAKCADFFMMLIYFVMNAIEKIINSIRNLLP